MRFLWQMTLDDYIEICEIARARGLKPGDSLEAIMVEYAQKKGIKPLRATGKTDKEIMKDLTQGEKTVLDMKTDKDGETDIRIIKGKKNDEEKED